ncbi:MAG TPA: VOC family protein [Steroidobacteraceae bacterium]|nr:VOC family protein [Steroidobacteraceae bacterium]
MSERNQCIDYIELPATNATQLAQAKAFYASTFGWKYQDWGDEYSDTQSSGVNSGLNAGTDHRPRAPLPVVYADDLTEVRSNILANHGKVTREIFSFPGGRRFHFLDPAGNELAVWSDK